MGLRTIRESGCAMTYESEMAESYRARAKQLRAIADADREPTNAATLRSIASNYDLMADTLEQIDRTNQAPRKS
jgi:hypothetical protein